MRLIDADALMDKITSETIFIKDGLWVSKIIADAPTVEIVRCKDCRHKYEEGDCTHYYWCRINDRPIDDTDFCSWAERREP